MVNVLNSLVFKLSIHHSFSEHITFNFNQPNHIRTWALVGLTLQWMLLPVFFPLHVVGFPLCFERIRPPLTSPRA